MTEIIAFFKSGAAANLMAESAAAPVIIFIYLF